MKAVHRTFVGRERELADLEAGVEETLAGRGQLYLLAGEAGIGKTRLCDELALRASDRGLLVRWGRCWEVGGAPPYWPWIQLLRALLRERRVELEPLARETLARLLPELALAGAAPAPWQQDSAEQRFQLFDAVTQYLRDVSRDTPLLAILDDLHAADPSSLALRLFVARELRDLRVCLIGTYRDREVLVSQDARESLARLAREAHTLAVARFNQDEVRALLVQRPGVLDEGTLESVYQTTEGLPLFVAEVARSQPNAGRWTVPDTIRAALSTRVAALPSAVREVLEAVAVLGRESSRSTLALLLGVSESALEAPLSVAIAAGVAAQPEPELISFSHALLRDAIYRELPEARRCELHERAADLLERTGAPEAGWGEVANHLLAARARVGTERALRGSLRAAERAVRTYAFEDAIAIVEQALGAVDAHQIDPRLRCELSIMLGDAQIRAHREGRESCLQAVAIARELGDATLLARAGLALGAEIWAGRVNPTLIGVLEEALRALPTAASSLRARVLARLAGAMQPAQDPRRPIEIAREAIAMARSGGDEATLRIVLHGAGAALVDYAPIHERIDVDVQTLALAEAAHDWPLAFRAGLRLFFDHLERGAWSDADAALRGCEALAHKLRRPRMRWYVAMMQALRADMLGELERGDQRRGEAMALMEREGESALRSPFALHRFAHALLRHDHDRLFELVPDLPATSLPTELAEVMRTMMLAVCHARTGQLDRASALLRRIDLQAPALRYELMALWLAGEACVRCGLRDVAALLLEHLEHFEDGFVCWGVFGFGCTMPKAAFRGNMLATLGQHDAALAAFDDAAIRCRQLRARPALARTLYDAARTLLARNQAGDSDRAATLIGEAHALAAELQMPGLVRWIESLRVAEPTPARALEALQATTFSLRREGDVWLVTHGARAFRLKHSRGLEMLAQLVANPGREVHALALGAAGDPGDLGDAGPTTDVAAVRAYRNRLEALREREQRAEALADSDAAERARSEIEQIAEHLSAALGLGGKSRKVGSAAERARVNVQRRIKDAIGRIAREDPELGRYLGLCVRTGTFSMFQPIR